MKFSSSGDDPLNVNYCIHHLFCGQIYLSVLRHKHFKFLFTCVDPMIPNPDINKHPNWKLHPFLNHMNKVSTETVLLGVHLYFDEQTFVFQVM